MKGAQRLNIRGTLRGRLYVQRLNIGCGLPKRLSVPGGIVGDDDPNRPFLATLLGDEAAIGTVDEANRRPHAPDEADVLKDGQLPVDRVAGFPGVPGKAGNTYVIEDHQAAGGLTDGGRASLPFLLSE
jgi:hypothetical protein